MASIMRSRSRNEARKVSPPGPTYMSHEQVGEYLSDLRNNRPPRPNGARPLPMRAAGLAPDAAPEMPPRASSAMSMTRPSDPARYMAPVTDVFPRSSSVLSHRRSNTETSSLNSSAGRPLVQEPTVYSVARNFSPAASIAPSAARIPSGTYRESGQRWMERQEVRSLRDALAEMDFQEEEKRIHAAAQAEATELVLNHQNLGFPPKDPGAPYRNPDLAYVNRFRQHLEKGSHARSQSFGNSGEPGRNVPRSASYRSASDSSTGSYVAGDSADPYATAAAGTYEWKVIGVPQDTPTLTVQKQGTRQRRPKVNFALPAQEPPFTSQAQGSGQWMRTVSSDSSKGIFRNPEDQIYEEPEEPDPKTEDAEFHQNHLATSPLMVKPRNSLPRFSNPPASLSTPLGEKLSQIDIHKNPPTQLRNPQYKSNVSPLHSTINNPKGIETAPTKNGVEIRSDAIRAATSMRLKDRSAKLPMPSAVTNQPGRPIVSFDPSWKGKKDESELSFSKTATRDGIGRSVPRAPLELQSTAAPGSVPAVNVADVPGIPTIHVPGEPSEVPSISVSRPAPLIPAVEPPSDTAARPLPNPARFKQKRSLFRGRVSMSSRNGWQHPHPLAGVPTASCANCTLPISGRIVTACNLRFHPECFTCHHCSTQLECVAFYQEPETKRAERLANAAADDEEAQLLRFYCHLDFHELFSPRCKSCKTPIEGEVVIALGAEWHVGHFFCAECGDPFTPTTPFVENAGFAWCLQCHSRRTASRCLGCKQPVLEDVAVEALGGQWHEKCFVCIECGGGFGIEGRFFIREGEPKTTATGRRVGGPVEVAVCEACEGRRLKAGT